jgi:hypothetical protein
MEWGRLYANLPDDPRVQRAEADGGAGWLLIESMCYCTSAETGGFIPHTQIERFGGGASKKKKIAALVRERLWLPVGDGYTLNPDLWTEERNLSDSAEKKREADRKRIAAKRAAEKAAQNGHLPDADMSRDSRATCRATHDTSMDATCRSDSRSIEKRREETSTAEAVSHPTVTGARRTDDDDGDELASAVITAVLDRTGTLIEVPEARAVAAKVLARAAESGVAVHHPPRYVAAAVAQEPDLYESLLLDDPPLLGEILSGQAPLPPLRAVTCGSCDPRTRMREDGEGRPYRCPECHPAAAAQGRSA